MSCVWPFYGYSILSLIRWWYWVNGFLFPLFMLFLHSYIWIYIHICKLYMILSYDLYYDRILQYLFSSQSLAISQFWLPCRAFTFIYIYMWLLICNLYYMSNINMSILDNILPPSLIISPSLKIKFVPKYKLLFKFLDTFINTFPNITLLYIGIRKVNYKNIFSPRTI
jgi:hypothetical protein